MEENRRLLLLGRQPGCACGRTFVPPKNDVTNLRDNDHVHTCECGRSFPLSEGYIREFTHDWTQETHAKFLSDWVEVGFIDPTPGVAQAVLFDDPPSWLFGVFISGIQFSGLSVSQGAISWPGPLIASVHNPINPFETRPYRGFILDSSHASDADQLPQWTATISWKAYGRRSASPLPTWLGVMRLAQQAEENDLFDAAVGLYSAVLEAFVNELLIVRLQQRTGLSQRQASEQVEKARKKGRRNQAEVVRKIEVLGRSTGVPQFGGTPEFCEWDRKVHKPRNDVFHGRPINAKSDDCRAAFSTTLKAMVFLDRGVLTELILPCYD